jgi:rod shape-determining protein MreC
MRFITSPYRPWVVYAGCSLAALAIFTSNLRGGEVARRIESVVLSIMSPFYSSIDWTADTVSNVWTHYIYLIDVQEENLRITEELSRSQAELTNIREHLAASDRYQHLLKQPFETERKRLLAKVVRRGKQTWNSVLIIGAGKLDGVQPFMGVTSLSGVVGQAVRIAPRISKVITLLHPQSGIAVILQKSRISGIVTGSGTGTCAMKFASRFDRIILGETVLTSGLDGAFPKGVPVGQVSRIERHPGEIFQTIEITPFVDLATVEEVVLFLPDSIENLND